MEHLDVPSMFNVHPWVTAGGHNKLLYIVGRVWVSAFIS